MKTENVSVLSQAYRLITHDSGDGEDDEKELLHIYQQCGFPNLDAPEAEVFRLRCRWEKLKDSQDIMALKTFIDDAQSLQNRAAELNLRLQMKVGQLLNELNELVRHLTPKQKTDLLDFIPERLHPIFFGLKYWGEG